MARLVVTLLVLLFAFVTAAPEKRILNADVLPQPLDSDDDDPQVFPKSLFDKIDFAGCGQRPLLSNNGASELVLNSRIVGGKVAVAYSWPAICSLRLAASPDSHRCGANLVRNARGVYYLITAAHCLADTRPNRHVAYCAIHSTYSSQQPYRVILSFSRLVAHSSYNSWTLDYDIAVLTPSTQPATSTYLQAVCLPNELWNKDELAIAAGWGTLSSGGSLPYQLHQVVKPIKDRQTCRQRYGASAVTTRMVCAGVAQGGIDSCQGDSGGPLYTYREGRWTLTGIVSWGHGCAQALRPGVYVDVAELKAWINTQINS